MTELPVVKWTRLLVNEALQAPTTLRRARHVLGELGRLPMQLDELITTLDRTNVTIERSLGELGAIVGELHGTLTSFTAGTEERIDHLDAVVSELTGALTAIIGAIPGARRALNRASPAGD
jgi:hypothetical protein